MMQFIGIALAVVGIGLTVYFGLRRHKRAARLSQQQQDSAHCSQSIRFGQAPLPGEADIQQEQTETQHSDQQIE